MMTLITRFWWMVVSLILLFAITFLLLYTHTANIVQNAANAARQVAAITADSSALQSRVAQDMEASLPTSQNGQVLFQPTTDITTTNVDQNQEVEVSVTYHMPVLGPLQNLFGLGPTVPITRTVTQALDYPHNGLHAMLNQAPPSLIGINQVVLQVSGQTLKMTVNGYGFGNPPSGVPGTTQGTFFIFHDLTQGWEAGSPTSGLSITYGSWTNQQITVTGIQNFGKGTEVIQPGDNAQVTVVSAVGSTTYNFVANPAGTTNYSASLSASATSVSTTTPVTLTASSSIPGNGTNGIGIYNASTGAYLSWLSSGDTVKQLVNSGTPQAEDFIAYYGPQGQIGQALATSNDVGVTWTGGQTGINTSMFENSSGAWFIDVMGENLSGATVTGNGLSGQSQVSANEIQINSASGSDNSGVVTLSDGTQIPFTATPY